MAKPSIHSLWPAGRSVGPVGVAWNPASLTWLSLMSKMGIKIPLQAEIPMRQKRLKCRQGPVVAQLRSTETCLQFHGSSFMEPSPFPPPPPTLSALLFPTCLSAFQLPLSAPWMIPGHDFHRFPETLCNSISIPARCWFPSWSGDPPEGAAVAKGWLVEWISGQVDGRSNLPQLHLWQKLTSFVQIGDIPEHFMIPSGLI